MRVVFASMMLALILTCETYGDIITQWNFNSVPADGNVFSGTTTPNIGNGVASLVGGATDSFQSGNVNGGSSDPAPIADNSSWQILNFAPQGGTARGVQFSASTVGFSGISIQWDQRHGQSSSRGVEFFYSIDGANFTSFALIPDATAGDTWFNTRTIDLSSLAQVNNNANFSFRILQRATDGSNYEASNPAVSYLASGTWRFDMVTINAISAVPEPTSIALLVFATMGAGCMHTRRKLFR